ncbi:Glycerol-3-phosphate acyltransferase [Thermoanaerobacter sp. YS13]|uniref:glycerol-3-phosphate acyltransferase n=1 Tax=Thermoanaerobacter sp. YS13 TaxID=1511746 RepID=UPI000574D202|nr:glycerol-3-phosphate acyltransferase [Thermoanaerobacter sp. YS13]KHO63190.1 Glycerol-3-phosphate acyltransferase [Thermoanaerobacter sp. YS13]
MIILLSILEFGCGSLMFSYWMGLMLGKRLEEVRDGNPGAFNLGHAAGFKMGVVGATFDFMKGYFPLVYFLEKGYVTGNAIAIVAIAPILGHAFSSFLKFKGGKALATTFGVWSAITRFKASLIYAVILGILKLGERRYNRGKPSIPEIDAVLDLVGFGILGGLLFLSSVESYLLLLWMLNFAVLLYKRKNDMNIVLKAKMVK